MNRPNTKTLKEMRADSRYLNVNINGNKKLVNNDKTAFIIWNIPALITCPFATDNCKYKCYALKAEKLYPNVKKSRYANLEASKKSDFVANMIYTLDVEISRNEARGRFTVVRIHESGDFYNAEYFNKWLEICRAFIGRKVVFMAYTKSVRYIVGADIPCNMSIRFSLWDDTKGAEYEIARDLHLPIYTAYDREKVDSLVNSGKCEKCDCFDCANCGKCWNTSKKAIACVIH